MVMDSKTRMTLATGGRDGGDLTKPTLPTFPQENVHDHSHSFSLPLKSKSFLFRFLAIFTDEPFSTM